MKQNKKGLIWYGLKDLFQLGLMRYKIYEYRYTFKGNFAYAAKCIEDALNSMGHEKVEEDAELHVYNHTCRDLEPDMPENSIIFKPTSPTSKHFQIDTLGYANSGFYTFNEPDYKSRVIDDTELNHINDLIDFRANKWDDSILLKWKDAKNVRDDHILIIGQMPEDETVNGFGFGDHWKKMCMIIDKLKDENLVIKLHPRITKASHIIRDLNKQIEKWKDSGHQVITGFESIHSVLHKTRVAITENSTAGIECMMHNVPIISYGYPDYHWITKDLRILTELKGYVHDLSWYNADQSQQFLIWYIYDYLCNDMPSTHKRLGEILNANI
jgi:hypothetical protein